MAVGFDRPCVGLFGPTDPAMVGPWAAEDAVVRALESGAPSRRRFRDPKLGDALMRLIAPSDVLARVDRVRDRAAGTVADRAQVPEGAAS